MNPPQKEHKEPQPEPKSRFVPITAIAVIIILIVAPAWVFLPQILSSESDSTLMELDDKAWKVNEDLQNFLYYNASKTIVTENSRAKYMGDQFDSIDIVYLESLLNQAFNDHINDVYKNERSDHKVDITGYEIKIGIDFYNTNDRVQNISINVDGDLNTYNAGEFGTATSPVYYKLYGEFTIKVTDRETDKSIIRVMTFNKSLRVPEPFYLAKLNEFQNNANTEVSDIGRMVRYMLNTVARYRAKVGYGQGPFDSPRNILNEGDVELAVNLAVILEEALLFRAYDHEAVQALDSNYFELSEATRAGAGQYNPTGKRIWGEAEISNYVRYVSNLPGNSYTRSLTNLIDKYVEYGYIDPADLLVMYMCLDNDPYPEAIEVDPKDELSVLEDEILLNPRDNYGSSYDVSNLDYILTTNLEEPFEFWRGGNNEDLNWSVSTEKLEVDQQPNYLIVGSEQLSIENIYPPRGWYTNIDLNNIQCGNLTPSGTRCPAQPPPPKPPDHDFRLQWDLEIFGKFELGVRRSSDYKVADGTHTNPWYYRTINFEFPISIFLWFGSLPQNNAITFKNLNKGALDPETAVWITEPDAVAFEYFSESLWNVLRPIVGANFDFAMAMINFVQSYGYDEVLILDGPDDLKATILDALLWRNSKVRELIDDNPPWLELYTFMDEYIEKYNLTGVELREIWLDGYKIDIDVFVKADLINIQITTDYGFIKLSFENIHNIKTRNLVVNEEFSISEIMDYGANIDFGQQIIFASGVLLDEWEFTIYTSELNIATDLKVPFVFYDNEQEILSSLTVNIPLDFEEFNFTFEIMFNPSSTTDDFSNTLTEISDNLNSVLVTYNNWNARNFGLLITNITDQLETELADLKDEYGDLFAGFSIGVDRNSFYNAPLKIIFIETESSNDFQYLVNILNWIDYNSLELISILGHSSIPLIELSNLMTNFEGSQADFGNIGFILLVGLAKASTKFEFIENVIDDNNLNEGWFYIYTNLNNIRALMTSEIGAPSLVAGYIDQPLMGSTIEPYHGILLTQDLPQMQPIISITVNRL